MIWIRMITDCFDFWVQLSGSLNTCWPESGEDKPETVNWDYTPFYSNNRIINSHYDYH